MYDEKMIEDSLAFAEEIRARLEGKKTAGGNAAQQTSSANSSTVPVVGQSSRQNTVPTAATTGTVSASKVAGASSPQQVQQPQSTTRPVQPQSVRQPQSSTRPVQPQATTRPVQPQSVRQPQSSTRPVQPQSVRQPQSSTRPVQPQSVRQPQSSTRPVQPQVPQQPQTTTRPVQPQVPQQPQATMRPVQPQPVQQPQATMRPVQPQPASQPVKLTQSAAHPAQQPQGVLPEGQINRQVIPNQQADTVIREAEHSTPVHTEHAQAEVPRAEMPKKEHLISVSTSTSRPVRASSSALETISEETKPMDGNEDHTVEITIKLDVAGIKKKFSNLKKKLAPEERTLEQVNAAMEENRQMQVEKEQEKNETIAEKGAAAAQKAVSAASGAGKKLSGFLHKKQVTAATMEEGLPAVEGQAVEGEIVQLEGEAVEENRFLEKIQDIKEVIPQKAEKATNWVTNIIIIAFCIGIAYFLASFVTTYVAHQTTVEGESMEPTLTDGDSVIIQRLSYYLTDPKRYDVVVFPVNYDDASEEKTYYIKRVIGLPGETVQIIDGSVYINNEKLSDDKYAATSINEAGIAESPLVLGENQYFVMGDNRNMSTDSRNSYVGLVNKNDIIGEAWLCTWPLNHFGGLK